MWTIAARLVRRSTEQLFRHVEVDAGWLAAVRAAAARGPLVYVLRNVSAADYLALEHLVLRHGLPALGFVNELPRWLAPHAGGAPDERLRAALAAGHSAALFVKRAPDRLGLRPRGPSEGDRLLGALVRLQRARREREIVLLPQTFVWSEHSEKVHDSFTDLLFGPVDFPGELRMGAQVLLHHRHARVRAGEPLGLRTFLEVELETRAAEAADADERVLLRRLTYVLLRRVERERRAIVGPARRLPDRVREEVLRSGRLQATIAELAGPGARERDTLIHKARGMLRELETAPEPQTQKALELVVERLVSRVYSGIDVDEAGLDELRAAIRRGSVVLLPSHKSHVDYIALSYVLRKHGIPVPVIAAGDNLSFFPVGPLLRRAGAFFIRRSFGSDRLYVAVVDAYVRRLLRDGHLLEFFLEGGRSRTGKLLPPMLGLLNLVVTAALGLEGRPVTFVPVSIGYERLMEERAFARELAGHDKAREDAAALLRLGGVLFDRWGRINIQLGRGIELGELFRELGVDPAALSPAKRRSVVKTLAHRAMAEINRVTAITPGALVALILLGQGGRGLAYQDLCARARRLTDLLVARGARTTPSLCRGPGAPVREVALREALALYVRSGLVVQQVPGTVLGAEEQKRVRLYRGTDVVFTVPDGKRLRLDLAKNAIVHWLVDRAFVAVALGAELAGGTHGTSVPLAALRAGVQNLVRLFRYEFAFRTDKGFEALLDEVLADMLARGELVRAGDGLAPPTDPALGRELAFYAAVVQNFIEAYRVAARGLRVLVRGPLPQKELVARALRGGERMLLRGEIARPEAVSRPMLDNAIAAFLDQGYLVRADKALGLAESFASTEAARTIEARIAALVPG
ncbi:MAG: 1-acyl-sn-glycerol-3-phosphate acyltransferase [Myxococcales bacterium]|nr:1-acyl-sn-glycerol-3-phosphate acyltransferase [Myxococcales bacterium]